MGASVDGNEFQSRLLRRAVEQSGSAILIVNVEGNIEYVNPRFTELSGYGLEEVRGKNPRVLKSGAQGPKEYEGLWNTILAGEDWRGTLQNKKKNGDLYWVSAVISPVTDEDGVVTHFVGVHTDITEKKRSEKELRMFRDLIDRSTDAIEIIDPDTGHFLDVNRRGCSELGYTREEMLSLTVADIDPTVGPDDFRRMVRELRGSGSMTWEGVHKRKDGSTFPVEVNISLVHQDRDVIVSLARNITERKQAEGMLREKERVLSTLMEHLPGMAYRCLNDADWTMEFVSKGCLAVTGYEAEDLIGNRTLAYADLIFHEHRQMVADQVAKAVERREPFRLTYRITDAMGRDRWVWERGSAVYGADGEVTALEGFIADVTVEILAEEAFRRSEEQYRELVQHAMSGIFTATRSGRLLQANPAFVQMLGFDSENELLAVDSVQHLYVNPEVRPGVLEGFERGEEARIQLRTKDGRLLTVRTFARPIHEEGEETVYQSMVQDITEQAKLEERYHQAQRLEAVGQLAGGVAHDFNNILSVIIVEAQLALRRLDEDDPIRERLTEIRRAGERATDLTRQLLAFSRRQVVKPVVMNLNTLVADMSSMLSRLIAEDIHLHITTDDALGNILADRGQTEQIVANLVVNARDAMPRGGDLTIQTRMVFPGEALLRAHPVLSPGPHVVLEIRDTGVGIPLDVQARMFEPFFTTKDLSKGTGLGLATVYGIVEQMRGCIDVDSEVGLGTTMRIYLPVVDEAVPVEDVAEPQVAIQGSETVLLTEDDARVRRIALQLLEEQGYTVLEAEDGLKALEQMESWDADIDLLLTDVVMPNMGGRELAERFQGVYPDAKVLYMSGYTDDDEFRQELSGRDVSYLEKPFTAEGLAGAVRDALDVSAGSP